MASRSYKRPQTNPTGSNFCGTSLIRAPQGPQRGAKSAEMAHLATLIADMPTT